MGDWMTVKDVAAYLGINEKKVYALAKHGHIPCTRVTGKWLFPRHLIDQWIEESARRSRPPRRSDEGLFLLVAGSDDPCLGLLRDAYTQQPSAAFFLATVGSRAGLAALRDGTADLALAHLVDPSTGEYNLSYLAAYLPAGGVVVTLFHRTLGLLVWPDNPRQIRSLADLTRADIRMVNRQEGSGTRWYLDHELRRLGIAAALLNGYDHAVVTTHLDVGFQVLRGEADTGLATQATARLLGLTFVPLTQERFDMVIPKAHFFSPRIESVLNVVSSRDFRRRVEAVGGYDTRESGRLHLTTP